MLKSNLKDQKRSKMERKLIARTMYNGSSRLLTGGMEGCPPPEMQTCFEGSNCRGNVYNECELLVFINLSLFFAFLTVILMLLTYQVINCRKFCHF